MSVDTSEAQCLNSIGKTNDMINTWYFNSLFEPGTYKIVSDEDYIIKPKPHIIKRQLTEAQTALETAKRLRDMALESYTKRIEELQGKVDELERSLKSASG